MLTTYWENLNKEHERLMAEGGYANFKRAAALVYNNDLSSFDMIKNLWEGLYEIVPESLLTQFEEPQVGNPICILCNNKKVTIDLGCSIREYYVIQDRNFSKINKIIEIGGGYGRLAYVFGKMNPGVEYVMCEVEPTLSLAKRYLGDVLPNGNFKFITPEELDGKCDLLIAANCLHEMTKEQVDFYFDYADKNAGSFYYSCWNHTVMPFDGIVWSKEDYPVRKHWKSLLDQSHIRPGWFERMYKI